MNLTDCVNIWKRSEAANQLVLVLIIKQFFPVSIVKTLFFYAAIPYPFRLNNITRSIDWCLQNRTSGIKLLALRYHKQVAAAPAATTTTKTTRKRQTKNGWVKQQVIHFKLLLSYRKMYKYPGPFFFHANTFNTFERFKKWKLIEQFLSNGARPSPNGFITGSTQTSCGKVGSYSTSWKSWRKTQNKEAITWRCSLKKVLLENTPVLESPFK